MKRIKYFLIPFIITAILGFGLNKYLYYKNISMLYSKDMYTYLHNYESFAKDKGIFSNDYLMKRGYILMLGSSELGHSTWQHPETYFNRGKTKHGVITVGRAYNQSLTHAEVVGSTSNDIKERNVVLLVSMQWFMAKDGVTNQHFLDRFSPLQFYALMKNPKISDKTKKEYAQRIVEVLEDEKGAFDSEYLYAKMYLNNSKGGDIMRGIFSPYYILRESMLKLQDKGITYTLLKQAPYKMEYDKRPIDWKVERELALKDAKKRVGRYKETLGGKRLYIDKGYYRKYIHKREGFLKGYYKDVDLLDSKECTDFRIFLDVCKDLDINPTIVIIPGMPQYYDYVKVPRTERYEYYNKIRTMVEAYGFRIVDVSRFEDTRYYLRDVMHLGTLGWADLSNRIYNIYEKGR